ncbi:sodium:proton exchanger [Catenuloplanes atrovinosus]|uniref:Cation:H+ antiporter n=1 Tax=Catenuloplanes atrovinosus TaxID=137266 RepID=A0AAE3YRE1_9ACTN|nr:sodium:proton exchanger [Catenuloplanes atrovinosus]MDR7277261.1 cation:H+ antiporter [Catenuloplanes atrovinosus]
MSLIALAATAPGVSLSLSGAAAPAGLAAAAFGVSIVGAAFLLAWAAEAAQVDVSAGLAVAVLALIAVLPEYAVDFVFAWRGGGAVQEYGVDCRAPGEGASACSLALANMTGANRILVGIGWALVVVIAWRRARRRGVPAAEASAVRLGRPDAVPLAFLLIASIYCLVLPFKRTLTLADTAVLVGIFAAYTWRISRAPAGNPDLIGPSAWLGGLPPKVRRSMVVAVFLTAATVILLTAEHFADALVESGTAMGVSEFMLVQWLAPLASEAPELLVAALYAWRLHTNEALGALVSSKVNQWTLLVGTLPIVFAVSSGGLSGLPIDPAQREELLLTAAQSLLAVALLIRLRLTVRSALLLLGLFLTQFVVSAVAPGVARGAELVWLSAVYLGLAAVVLIRDRAAVLPLLRDGLVSSYRSLGDPACCTTAGRLRLRVDEAVDAGQSR